MKQPDNRTNRERAEHILREVGGMVAPPDDTGVTGAIVGVGYALLAIHDELRTHREHEEQRSRARPLSNR